VNLVYSDGIEPCNGSSWHLEVFGDFSSQSGDSHDSIFLLSSGDDLLVTCPFPSLSLPRLYKPCHSPLQRLFSLVSSVDGYGLCELLRTSVVKFCFGLVTLRYAENRFGLLAQLRGEGALASSQESRRLSESLFCVLFIYLFIPLMLLSELLGTAETMYI
jgi:hypothetical protein